MTPSGSILLALVLVGAAPPDALKPWVDYARQVSPPGPGPGNQDSLGERPMGGDGQTFTFFNPKTGVSTTKTLNFGGARKGTHQLYAGGFGTSYQNLKDGLPLSDGTPGKAKTVFDAMSSNPLLYHIRLQVAAHSFTSSDVQPIDNNGNVVALPVGAPVVNGSAAGTFKLRPSTIYGFNGTFPGPMINFEYGRPAIVRFENDLDNNPQCLSRQDFGAPDWAFLTHLHNGHTAPESDGQPNHLQENEGGYQPGQWSDNLYLGYAAGGDDAEKQSFLWFHDHRMHHTGPNVYKGMVGLMPHYDPELDFGDERFGLRLPGVRTNNLDGSFDVKYDIPMALYDVCLAYNIPLISGKDSMKNDFYDGAVKISIPPTLLFSVIGRIEDARKAVTMDVKRPGDIVYLLGKTGNELGGSEYLALKGFVGNRVPVVDTAKAYHRYQAYHDAVLAGVIASCHDLSDGGLAVAAAESAFSGGYGMAIDLTRMLFKGDTAEKTDAALLFAESASRHLITIHPENQGQFETIMSGNCFASIGVVTEAPELIITGLGGTVIVKAGLAGLKEAWQKTLREL